MPALTSKTSKRPRRKSSAVTPIGKESGSPNVFTLAELAKYLRVTPTEAEHLASQQKLPGRRVGADWRFLKSAVDDWLRKPETDFWTQQFGALRDDPTLEDFLRETYRQRGRSVSEDA